MEKVGSERPVGRREGKDGETWNKEVNKEEERENVESKKQPPVWLRIILILDESVINI